MKNAKCLAALLLLGVLAAGVPGQLNDGDLVVGYLVGAYRIDPSSGAAVSLLPGDPYTIGFPNWVRMGENNTDLLFGIDHLVASLPGRLVQLTPGGGSATLAVMPTTGVAHGPQGFALDGDGTWVISAGNRILGYTSPSFYGFTTFVTTSGATDVVNNVTIDRDPFSHPYVAGIFTTLTTTTTKLFAADRGGIKATLVRGAGDPLLTFNSIDLCPETGHYLITDITPPEVSLVDKTGKVLSTLSVPRANGCRVNQDGTAWITGLNIVKVDLATMTIVHTVPNVNGGNAIEVYGSRRLVANGSGLPGSTVSIALQSRRPGDANQPYVLALALARRPVQSLGVGDRLALAPDPLFFASASGALASILPGFQGKTDARGNAYARVLIPQSFPTNLGITIFVAGVIYDARGVRTVTNTHWFTLR